MWWSQRGRRWQYGGTLRGGLVGLHSRKHTPAHPQSHTRSYTHLPKRARAHTHTHSKYVILIAFPLQIWFRERSSLLRYTYIVCLVMLAVRPGMWKWREASKFLIALAFGILPAGELMLIHFAIAAVSSILFPHCEVFFQYERCVSSRMSSGCAVRLDTIFGSPRKRSLFRIIPFSGSKSFAFFNNVRRFDVMEWRLLSCLSF